MTHTISFCLSCFWHILFPSIYHVFDLTSYFPLFILSLISHNFSLCLSCLWSHIIFPFVYLVFDLTYYFPLFILPSIMFCNPVSPFLSFYYISWSFISLLFPSFYFVLKNPFDFPFFFLELWTPKLVICVYLDPVHPFHFPLFIHYISLCLPIPFPSVFLFLLIIPLFINFYTMALLPLFIISFITNNAMVTTLNQKWRLFLNLF